jgi:hypothetical protein
MALGALALYAAESMGGGVRIGHGREKAGLLRGVREAVANYVGEFHPEDIIKREIPTFIRYLSKPTEAVPHEPVALEQSAEAMDATLLWQGFRLAFRDLPHRITWMESRVDGISAREGGVDGAAAVAFEGGDWSRVDGIEYAVTAQAVCGMKFAHLKENVTVRGGRAVKRVRIDLKALGLEKFPRAAALLRGFCFDTSREHSDGMTIKGLGVSLEPRGREGDALVVDIVVEFKAGPVAFRPDPGYDFELDATVYMTIASTNQGDFIDAPAHYMLRNRERAPERVQAVEADCGAGRAAVAAALRGFTFDLHTTRARFVREFSLQLKDLHYDPATGSARVLCDAYVSNMGTAAGALDVRFNADLVMLALPEGSAAATPQTISGELDAVTENTAMPLNVDL